jgi:ABC-type antimicrobial peptide transport system permease subunit
VRSQLAGSNPLGRAVRFDEGEPYTVVGVVKNVKQISVRENPSRMAIYIPFTQTPAELMGQINFEIRTALPAASLGAALRQAVRSVDPDLPLIGLQTEARVIAERMSDERSLARLVALFGLLALLLATVGLYGTVSYALARRTSEIGIRMAIGASRWDVVDWFCVRPFCWSSLALLSVCL